MLDEQTALEARINELKTRLALQAVVLTFRTRLWVEQQVKKWMQ